VTVRVLRPEAERVELLVTGEPPREMVKTDDGGFFELLLQGRTETFPYQLRVHYPDGNSFTLRDPYAFLPTLGTFDEHLFGEGRHERLYDKLGAHVRQLGDVGGVSFAVWAPNASGVSVVGNFNNWDGRLHQMRVLGASGIWEIFIPDIGPGEVYKYEIHHQGAPPFLKADPYALYSEVPPATSSIVFDPAYEFTDHEWIERREARDHLHEPLSIYEVHLGSWRHILEGGKTRALTYREMGPALADYVQEMGFTHVEFLPLKGFPYGGSWGYQVANYYAPTARYGTPDDFRALVDYLHSRGIGVIMDWVPAHFPKDAWALGRFDGTALYEHADPRQGEHPDWGTYIFNYGRNEVRNFLIANALFWIEECHIDGLRVDAVASMLYLDYSRNEGRWVPNEYGGRENLGALEFLRQLNDTVHARHPGVMMIAEESTAWPGVSRPPYAGGLGFNFKWNMGWMHDTLLYFQKDAIYRKYHHNNLTFGFLYAWSENYVLPFSHDEVVHGKGSLLDKMQGDRWQKFANLRALYAYMWAHPGKKLLFMGCEIGQWREWNYEQSLDWHLLEETDHKGLQDLVRELNRLYKEEPALWEMDVEPSGFQWIEGGGAADNFLAFMRIAPTQGRQLVCVCNFSAVVRSGYRVGLPRAGQYRQILNTDEAKFGGSGVGLFETITAEAEPWQGQPFSARLDLPPLAVMWLEVPAQ
jgi:1,4-alpha-glucan branching enzyme